MRVLRNVSVLWQLCSSLSLLISKCHAAFQPRVAIIGAGVGGAFNAHFNRHHLGPSALIDVFEEGEVGGRTQIFSAEGEKIELGASIVHEENKYFREAADSLKIARLTPKSSVPSIYDGKVFVFSFSYWTVVNLAKMVFRYGWNYFIFSAAPSLSLKRYKSIYALQEKGRAFATPEDMLKAMGLYDLTQRTFRDEIQALLGTEGRAQLFAREFLGAVNRVQYNQNNSISGMAGMVGNIPVFDGRVFKLEGGNVRLPIELLSKAGVRGHWPLRVTTVARAPNGSYTLQTATEDPALLPQVWGPYDAVVIATPLERAGLSFEGLVLPRTPPRRYRHTVTTVVQGALLPTYFGVAQLPYGEYIMVTEDAATPFSVIAPLSEAGPGGLRLYKLFSEAPLPDATLQRLFRNATVLTSRDWEAYPVFHAPEQFAPFQLEDGLFYINAWENSASAMEMSAVAAKNVALLLEQYLGSSGESLGERTCGRDGAGGDAVDASVAEAAAS